MDSGSQSNITGSSFDLNRAGLSGGAVSQADSSSVISGCQFISNSGSTEGGAVFQGNMTGSVSDCRFFNNTGETGVQPFFLVVVLLLCRPFHHPLPCVMHLFSRQARDAPCVMFTCQVAHCAHSHDVACVEIVRHTSALLSRSQLAFSHKHHGTPSSQCNLAC